MIGRTDDNKVEGKVIAVLIADVILFVVLYSQFAETPPSSFPGGELQYYKETNPYPLSSQGLNGAFNVTLIINFLGALGWWVSKCCADACSEQEKDKAVVPYTNPGKLSLFNRRETSSVLVEEVKEEKEEMQKPPSFSLNPMQD
jgi:hypothetical protein